MEEKDLFEKRATEKAQGENVKVSEEWENMPTQVYSDQRAGSSLDNSIVSQKGITEIMQEKTDADSSVDVTLNLPNSTSINIRFSQSQSSISTGKHSSQSTLSPELLTPRTRTVCHNTNNGNTLSPTLFVNVNINTQPPEFIGHTLDENLCDGSSPSFKPGLPGEAPDVTISYPKSMSDIILKLSNKHAYAPAMTVDGSSTSDDVSKCVEPTSHIKKRRKFK